MRGDHREEEEGCCDSCLCTAKVKEVGRKKGRNTSLDREFKGIGICKVRERRKGPQKKDSNAPSEKVVKLSSKGPQGNAGGGKTLEGKGEGILGLNGEGGPAL